MIQETRSRQGSLGNPIEQATRDKDKVELEGL